MLKIVKLYIHTLQFVLFLLVFHQVLLSQSPKRIKELSVNEVILKLPTLPEETDL